MSIDTIDYTYLQKKGFIKKREGKKPPFKVDSKGMIDFTTMENDSLGNSQKITDNNSNNPFSFLNNISEASKDNQSNTTNPLSDSFSTSASNISDGNAEINSVKIKIDDLEFKLAQLVDKLSLIEGKLENFERRILS